MKTHSPKLLFSALAKLISGLGIIMALLFLPAGGWHYWQAWLFIGLLFIPMITMGIWLYCNQPELLVKRLNHKEKEQTQKGVVFLSGMMFIGGFILCALDNRLGWSNMPIWLTIASSVVFLLGYGLYAEVMRENAYLSRTVEVKEGQKLIDKGLYGIVRHPMYTATILMFLSIPLILGSFCAMIVFALYPALMVIRIQNEEQVLSTQLAGYIEYKQRVRYRLIPWVW